MFVRVCVFERKALSLHDSECVCKFNFRQVVASCFVCLKLHACCMFKTNNFDIREGEKKARKGEVRKEEYSMKI